MKCIYTSIAAFLLLAAAHASAQSADEAQTPSDAPQDAEAEIVYNEGFDFSAALVSHALLEQVETIISRTITARSDGADLRAQSMIDSLQVFSLVYPELGDFEFVEPEQDVAALQAIAAKLKDDNGVTDAYDLGPTDGISQRWMELISDYLDTTYPPNLKSLATASDLASADAAPEALFMGLVGMQSIIQLNVASEYDSLSLFDGVENAGAMSSGLMQLRGSAEPLRRMMVEARRDTLTDDSLPQYQQQLGVLVDEIEAWSAVLRSSIPSS
ncbi:MAG: hypothetical protein CBC49_007540 [Alphaproteobacteria bacterium TMED89]|nr:hypothetical protein [Rhodospirillaceae bacterium]RPH12808.1 MAG: hypothetical protein CBC49_007540 [Alphaproteobacteria bacterium TMED89]